MNCQAQVGLLILRACGQPAVGFCGSCGIPLCGLHVGAGTCPNCMLAGGNPNQSELTHEAAARNEYYQAYGGQAQFGDPRYFSAGDRETLRSRGTGFAAAPASDNYDPFDT